MPVVHPLPRGLLDSWRGNFFTAKKGREERREQKAEGRKQKAEGGKQKVVFQDQLRLWCLPVPRTSTEQKSVTKQRQTILCSILLQRIGSRYQAIRYLVHRIPGRAAGRLPRKSTGIVTPVRTRDSCLFRGTTRDQTTCHFSQILFVGFFIINMLCAGDNPGGGCFLQNKQPAAQRPVPGDGSGGSDVKVLRPGRWDSPRKSRREE